MVNKILAPALLSLGLGVAAVSGQPQPRAFFKDYARLSDSEIQKIEQGQVVTKVLGSTDKYGMLVFGAVYINAPIEKFAASFRDVKKLKENKVYLDVQEFSPGGAAPKLFDFERLVLDKKDIDELHTCKPGECDLQVFDDIGAIQKKIDWNGRDKYVQANAVLRQRVLDGVTTYLSSGLKAHCSHKPRDYFSEGVRRGETLDLQQAALFQTLHARGRRCPQGGYRERRGIDERHVEHVLQQAQRQVTGESQ